MKTLILILVLLITSTSFCQNIGAVTDSQIDSIMALEMSKKSNFRKVGYTRVNCIGYGSSADAYLFWTDKTNTYVKKIECNSRNETIVTEFKPIKIEDSVFFSYFKKNKNKLVKELPLHFKYDSKKTKPNTVSSGYISKVHSCHRKFQLKIEESEFSKEYDFFDLDEYDSEKIQASNRTKEEMERFKEMDWEIDSDTIYENHPRKNINFEYNKELSIVKWNLIIKDFIAKLDSKNMFKKLTSE
jgi:hypothetical protein